MSDDSPESLGDDPTYVGKAKEREDQSLGDQSTYAGSNESSLSDLDGLGGSLADNLDGLEIVDLESRYTIIRPIGKGGMGEVFLATDTRLNRKVAIKRIKDELTTPAAAARFLTEAKSIAALSHPYIVQVYDYGRAKDGPFLIMEYVEGENLQQVCNQGVMALEDAIELSCKLCDALAKAHSLGIIHRDIKPANILMTEEGWPKISDFGLAKSTSDHGHTMTGTALGTLDFMPPEQRRDASAVDHRSDLWSLAATIYQMVTGEPPKVIDLEEVPPGLRTVLGKALKTQPDKRYQSAKSLKDDIEQCNSSDALPIGQLNIGECPNCNTRNESNRKYCRECAASLVIDCLKCGESIAVWDKICGECGNNQEEALKAKRSEYTRLQEEAEGLRLSYRYEEAIELSKQIGEDYESIFPDAAAWAKKFTADTQRDQAEQLEKTEKIYDAAKKARLNYDYRSACQMMEEIPEPLRLGELKVFFETAEREHNDVQRLQREINGRLNSKNLDGLLPLVEQLLKLQPERSSVKRLHKKTVKWDEEVKLRELEERIEDLSGRGMFDTALSLVEEFLQANPNSIGMLKVRDGLKEKEQDDLKNKRLFKLGQQIDQLIKAGKSSEALPLVEQYLEMSPESDWMQVVYDDLNTKLALVEIALKKTNEFNRDCKFPSAVAALESIPEEFRNTAITDLLVEYRTLGELRKRAFGALRDPSLADNSFTKGNAIASSYLVALFNSERSGQSFKDTKFDKTLKHFQQIEKELNQQKLIKKTVLLCLVALFAIVLLVAISFIRSAINSNRVSNALDIGDYQTALQLDPANTRALSMQKAADVAFALENGNFRIARQLEQLDPANQPAPSMKKAADVKKALDSGDFQAALQLNPANTQALSMKRAADVKKALDNGDFQAALQLDPANTQALSMKRAADVKKALDNGDYQAALQLDPFNEQALSMKKAADVKKALDSGDYKAALLAAPFNAKALSMKKAAELNKALTSGDYQTALQLDPTNLRALSMKNAAHIERYERTVLTLEAHTYSVKSVAFSLDGNSIVSASYDETLKIWDAKTGEEKLTLRGHAGPVYRVAFSPDGGGIVSGGYDGTGKTWDCKTGNEKLTLKGHAGPVYSIVFSPDGNSIVSGSYDETLKVWNAETGKEKFTLRGHAGPVCSVAFSPDGGCIVSGSRDNTIRIWDTETGKEKLTLKGHTQSVNSVAYSPDGKSICSGSSDDSIKIWGAISGEEKLSLNGHGGDVKSVTFSPDGNSIVSGSWDKTIKFWNLKNGEEKLTLGGHTRGINSVAFSPDGNSIVSGSDDESIKIWDLNPPSSR